MVLFLTKLSHSLFLKQQMHNIGTEITKTINYLQYIQNTEKRLKKLQTLLLIILMKVQFFFKTGFRLFTITSKYTRYYVVTTYQLLFSF